MYVGSVAFMHRTSDDLAIWLSESVRMRHVGTKDIGPEVITALHQTCSNPSGLRLIERLHEAPTVFSCANSWVHV
jgi:hypothetical protein